MPPSYHAATTCATHLQGLADGIADTADSPPGCRAQALRVSASSGELGPRGVLSERQGGERAMPCHF
jgi:hypothetical protein